MNTYDRTDRIGNFTVVRTLGNGGMGKVYLCRTPAGQRLAVKVIRRELADFDEIRQRFAREVKALLDVHSPYTVPVYAAETLRPPLWLATRYVAGPTLQARVSGEGPLPEPQVAALGCMLAEALSEVHARGVIHRDVKPSNIILEGGEPRLIDFGIARTAAAKGLTLPGTPLGTHGYMAPEQLLGREPTPAVDVFALGAVLAYAATGQPAFGTGEPASRRILEGRPPYLTGVSTPLAGLITACLATAAADRPMPHLLMAALSGLLGTEPGTGPGPDRAPDPTAAPDPDPVLVEAAGSAPSPCPIPRTAAISPRGAAPTTRARCVRSPPGSSPRGSPGPSSRRRFCVMPAEHAVELRDGWEPLVRAWARRIGEPVASEDGALFLEARAGGPTGPRLTVDVSRAAESLVVAVTDGTLISPTGSRPRQRRRPRGTPAR
ncbi:protein kinase [Streptomyces diastatochromogenes]|nr:protein kinase [Streptomyces diastatochromogenes]